MKNPRKLYTYRFAGKPFAAHPGCQEGFKADRRSGLIYGPAILPSGEPAKDREEFSLAEPRTCAYCGEISEQEKEKRPAFFDRFQVRHAVGNRHVGEPDFAIKRMMVRAFKRTKTPTAMITPGGSKIATRRVLLAALRFAVGVHRENLKVYREVMR
jgi:hypothetical protein